ncbi:TIGR03808 family TAT-translocated repetitive protein [Stappia sp. P2PMeth1]|uniref:TIGR03808 family TAT-translocated repetitive protein n=1 Tax=Stappia sp. P2PMeth1 TaxID=2003586 RepID=UPI0016482AB9|nr:TIGR03808 family TAT-translocated repetitive protein [Stappia sp. P2PMeth1]
MAYYRILDDAIVMDDNTFSGATSASLQAIFNQAVSNGLPLVARPGVYNAANISVTGPISVRGVPGKVTFRMTAGASGILYLGAFEKAEFYGIIFDGDGQSFTNDTLLQPSQGLVNMRKDSGSLISKADFNTCTFINSTQCGIGVNECRLLVTDCEFANCALKSIGVIATDGANVRDSRFEDQDYALHFSPGASTNVSVENNVVRRCRRNGIAFEPSGSVKINKNISVVNNKVEKLISDDTWAVSRTNPASTGAEGNGILTYLCENVVIEGNDVSDCEFSAIRSNVTSQITVTGNICRGSGETALYVETVGISVGEFGATVTSNVVYGGGAGISVVNFDFNGRFSTISNNVVRDITVRTITYSGGSYGTSGSGIYVEADTAVIGNSIQNTHFGLVLGTNTYTSDLNATGNVIRQTTLGIGVASSTPKDVLISSNLIAGFSSGAIKSVTYTGSGTPPYSIVGAELCPANLGSSNVGNVHIIGNVRRASL